MAKPSMNTHTTDLHLGLALQPRRLHQVLLALIAAIAVGLTIALSKQGWAAAAMLGVALLSLALAFHFNRRGQVARAASVMLLTLTVVMGGLVFLSQGLHDEAVIAFPGLLIFASMFSSRPVFIGLLLAMVAMLVGVVGADLSGWHASAVEPNSWGQLVNVVSILAVTAFFVWLLASDLRRAMARLQAEKIRLQESHARIEFLAHRDALTNLPNRTLARDRLSQILSNARRSGSMVAVLFLDLDNFKTVNDSLGHGAGDQLLCLVAERLMASVRETDTVSRQGGDEFLILLGSVEGEESATRVATKIMEQLAQPLWVNGLEVVATGSLGIAMFPRDGADEDSLLKNADMAMYRAKDAGRNAFRFFDAEMNSSVVEHLHLTAGIRTALTNGEFRLHYQPQFELATGRIVGAEALIRWNHPTLGFIPPGKFIPVAERNGLINDIGSWVLDTACRQTKTWQDRGLGGLVIAVNVSPVQFRRDDIEREVATAIETCAINPACIELELTESLLVADSVHLSAVLARLSGMGVKLAIDDFGTGYSNLGYLKRFAVERLKIDQSFVRDMTQNPHNDGIVRAIIEMAHCLQLEVVAEGVEDQATLERLQTLGCEFGQGYLWSPALPPDEFAAYVQARQPAEPGAGRPGKGAILVPNS